MAENIENNADQDGGAAGLFGSFQSFGDFGKMRSRATSKEDIIKNYFENGDIKRDTEAFMAEAKTGFSNLDKEAGGGLFVGVYTLAAIPSLGKTTFALQLADQLAAGGHDILFFSLEQSKLELVSKSLNRIAHQEQKGGATDQDGKVLTSLEIRKGRGGDQVERAIEIYSGYYDRISIIEPEENAITTEQLKEYIEAYIEAHKKRPIVFVDYLQLLLAADPRKSAREGMDRTMTELKGISRQNNVTIIAISSMNRSSYSDPVNFASLKESGTIEYTSDVVWGLQFQGMEENTTAKEINEKKAADPRKIELSCLKNRFGKATYKCYFDYYAARDLFKESEGNEGTKGAKGVDTEEYRVPEGW